jgi:putative Holliday junction resolvase
MKYLGIDYGRKKVGLAISDGKLADPLKVIRYKDINWLVEQVGQIVETEQVGQVVVGVSEGKMADEIKNFVLTLSLSLSHVSCVLFDETLTSQDAINFSIQGGIKRKKRKKMEDAYAATIMLQNYLDSK